MDSREISRNKNVCERFQGNRNPFVDHPEYVAPIFGEPKSAGEINCYTPTISPTLSPTPSNGGSPTPVSPTPSEPPEEPPDTEGACNGLKSGSVIPIAMNSENPDSLIFLPLVDLPQFSTLYVTDNAWTGNAFYMNEGTVIFTVPKGGIKMGTTFGYAVGTFSEGGSDASREEQSSSIPSNLILCCYSFARNRLEGLWQLLRPEHARRFGPSVLPQLRC